MAVTLTDVDGQSAGAAMRLSTGGAMQIRLMMWGKVNGYALVGKVGTQNLVLYRRVSGNLTFCLLFIHDARHELESHIALPLASPSSGVSVTCVVFFAEGGTPCRASADACERGCVCVCWYVSLS